ncbi:unnamed protein product, partial [marine sediment metagenome]
RIPVYEETIDNIIKPNKAITSNINIIKLRGSSKK